MKITCPGSIMRQRRGRWPAWRRWKSAGAGKVSHRGRGGQGAAVDALQQAFTGQFTQVAADGVFRQAQFFTEGFGDDLAILVQAGEQEFLALTCQHVREFSRCCTILHDIVNKRNGRTTPEDRIRIHKVETLSDDRFLLQKTTFDYRRRDGSWQRQTRETYDRGNGAPSCCTTASSAPCLVRQFRFPTYGNGHDGFLIETAAGLLDRASPEERIKAEVEEETGYRVGEVRKVFEAFMSPGSVTERLYFFVAEYDAASRTEPAAAWPKKAKTSKCWN
jgi:nudix-type nucleoside diphosphatase (YffH/AdpP family)